VVKVLIADSGAAFKRSAAEALSDKGFAVTLAATPEEAFEIARSASPEIILYDMDLPGYEGAEALKLFARMRGARESFILANSIHSGGEYAAAAREAGAWDFIVRPVDQGYLVETAVAVKRHLRRPREVPRKPANRSLKSVSSRCPRPGCGATVYGFALRGKPMLVREDQFETPIFTSAAGGHEFVDYNLLSVSVCPECYRARDEAARPVKPEGGAPRPVQHAPEPALFRIAAEADDTLFSEDRSPSAALAALRLAIETARAEGDCDSPADLGALADLYFKAAAVSHGAEDERARDRFLGEAEKVCAAAVEREPCGEVYRAAYRLAALYVFFARDADAAATLETFERFAKPAPGRMKPRDARVLEKYHAAASRMLSSPSPYRRAAYPAGL